MKKTERLLALVLALKQNGKMTAAELAAFLEVNIRTIYRDIDALSQMGVPLIAHPGKEGGYEILKDYFLPSVSFTRDEVLALSIAKDLILNADIPGFDPFIRSAFLKISNITPREEQERIQLVTDRILFDMKYIVPPPADKEYFRLIRTAFEENRCLLVSYYSVRRRDVTERLVYPLVLTFSDGVWYLRGKSSDKSFIWWFRLDRIRRVRISEETFALPPGFSKHSLSLAQNTGGDFPVEIAMTFPLYETVKEDLLFQRAEIREEEGEMVLSFDTDRKNMIFEFLFRNAGEARLISPRSLLEELGEKIVTLKERYRF